MSEGSLFTGLQPTEMSHGNLNPWSDAPLAGPDGQPMLAMVGDLGDTLVSGGTAPSGGANEGVGASPVSGSGTGLVINVAYDQSTSSLPSGFVAAVNYVVNYYESLFTTPTTVNIDVGYGEIDNQALGFALGASESFVASYNYSAIKSALANSDPGAAASMPTSQPVSGTMLVTTAEAKALSLPPAQQTTDLDGYVGFSSALPFTYDPNNRAIAGQYDFIGVVEHEFSEVMGRIDSFGQFSLDGINPAYSLFDMFHYTSPGAHTYTGTTPNYFSADGGNTNLDSFNSDPSGDLGDWAASAGADSYLAFSPSDQANIVSQADITAMNALGYETGPIQTVIEAAGSTKLVLSGDNYYLDSISGGTGPTLKYGGAPVLADSFGGWTAIGAEAATAGYEVALKVAGFDAYTVWNTDTNGNFVGNEFGVVSGTSIQLESFETAFHQDFNHDGTIGIPGATVIETQGATELILSGNNYDLDSIAAGTGPTLKFGGSPVLANSFSGWTAIGVEATGGGYEVALKVTGFDAYTVWNTDTNGNFVGNAVGVVSGTDAAFQALELSFQQDLNGDGTIGTPGGTVIESAGSTELVLAANNYYFDPTAGGTGPTLKFGGAPVAANAFSGWTAIGVEAAGGGYEVALKVTGFDAYTIWNTDANGNFTSNAIGVVSGTNAAFEAFETSFQQDLNKDGNIGIPTGGGSSDIAHANTIEPPDAPLIGLPEQDSHHGTS